MPKLLLIEDNELNRDMLARRLAKKGYEVVVAVDGERGVALAQLEAPALILMDMSLPVLDGWEATRQLKAAPATAAIPVIALTAHAMSGDRERAMEVGGDRRRPRRLLDAPAVDLFANPCRAPGQLRPAAGARRRSAPVTGRSRRTLGLTARVFRSHQNQAAETAFWCVRLRSRIGTPSGGSAAASGGEVSEGAPKGEARPINGPRRSLAASPRRPPGPRVALPGRPRRRGAGPRRRRTPAPRGWRSGSTPSPRS